MPRTHGGGQGDIRGQGSDPADAFEVIVPALPGFGFSNRPRERDMTNRRIAELWTKLMSETLGYGRFAAMAAPDLLVEDLRAFFCPLRDAEYEGGREKLSANSPLGRRQACDSIATGQAGGSSIIMEAEG